LIHFFHDIRVILKNHHLHTGEDRGRLSGILWRGIGERRDDW